MVWDSNASNDKEQLHLVAKRTWQHPLYFIACGFGLGLMPIVPGTFASMAGVVLFFMLLSLPVWAYAAVTLAVIVLSVALSQWVINQTGLKDPTCVCVDEIAGVLVAFAAVPVNGWLLVAFILFRVLDIWKPWPFGWMDRNIHGGFGMVLDDVAIGLFTSIVVNVAARLIA